MKNKSYQKNSNPKYSYPKNTSEKKQRSMKKDAHTEPPFSGELLYNEESGTYQCSVCGNELFTSGAKFDSSSGWPSFDSPKSEGKVKIKKDFSHFMIRDEVVCAKCGSHLGHLFNDGPTSTGKRYCINSYALDFVKQKENPSSNEKNNPKYEKAISEKAIFAAGCFWHVEEAFGKVNGVIGTKVGYTGGSKKNPTYEEVCSDNTGHAEAVEVVFDPKIISYSSLLEVFFKIHNPTTINRQGPDVGSQYRSEIFYLNGNQKLKADKMIKKLNSSKEFHNKIVTKVSPAKEFYDAEGYHQKYYKNHKMHPLTCGIL